MFLRIKKFGRNKQRRYYYLVKSIKINGRPKQKVIKYLGTLLDIVDMIKKGERCLKEHLDISKKLRRDIIGDAGEENNNNIEEGSEQQNQDSGRTGSQQQQNQQQVGGVTSMTNFSATVATNALVSNFEGPSLLNCFWIEPTNRDAAPALESHTGSIQFSKSVGGLKTDYAVLCQNVSQCDVNATNALLSANRPHVLLM